MKRSGFTLIELLVVVIIMLILTAITVTSVNSMLAGDRTRSAARQIQSYLEGARDRAIYAREPRGVRFLLDDPSATTVSSMVFIGAPEFYSEGEISIERLENPNNPGFANPGAPPNRLVRRNNTDWRRLARQGLLALPSRIQLGKTWYTVSDLDFSDPNKDVLIITPSYRGAVFSPANAIRAASIPKASDPDNHPEYRLELAPAVLPNQEPMLLPRGVVIDLDGIRKQAASKIPASWFPSPATGGYSPRMDIMFSPRGTVTGATAASGVIHLLLSDVADVEHNRGLNPGDGPYRWLGHPDKEGEEILVTLFTHTGHITTSRIDPSDLDGDGLPDDPLRLAETGETAK